MPSTPGGLPYPADTDFLGDTAQHIKKLASTLRGTTAVGVDPGGVSLGAGVVGAGEGVVVYRCVDQVTIRFYIKCNTAQPAGSVLFNIPGPYRPAAIWRFGGTQTNGTWTPLALITDGSVLNNLPLGAGLLVYGSMTCVVPQASA